jgi:hypothetical protein
MYDTKHAVFIFRLTVWSRVIVNLCASIPIVCHYYSLIILFYMYTSLYYELLNFVFRMT